MLRHASNKDIKRTILTIKTEMIAPVRDRPMDFRTNINSISIQAQMQKITMVDKTISKNNCTKLKAANFVSASRSLNVDPASPL